MDAGYALLSLNQAQYTNRVILRKAPEM